MILSRSSEAGSPLARGEANTVFPIQQAVAMLGGRPQLGAGRELDGRWRRCSFFARDEEAIRLCPGQKPMIAPLPEYVSDQPFGGARRAPLNARQPAGDLRNLKALFEKAPDEGCRGIEAMKLLPYWREQDAFAAAASCRTTPDDRPDVDYLFRT